MRRSNWWPNFLCLVALIIVPSEGWAQVESTPSQSVPSTTAQPQSGSSGVPWPWAAVGSVALVAVGALLKYLLDRRNATKNAPRKSIVCSATYCPDLLSPTVSQWQDDLELRVHGRVLANPVVIHYRIDYTGNTPAQRIAMTVRAAESDQIVRWNFYVDVELKCQRLKTVREEEQLLSFEWEYLNPNESLDLVLLVSPCRDAECVSLEVDGEGIDVRYRSMAQDCWACGVTSGR